MPQGNIETLLSACAGGSCDGKIACETLAAAADDGDAETCHQNQQPAESVTEVPKIAPESPPESFWLSKDAEYDWFDRNAFFERKESQKGNSAPSSTNLNPSVHSTSNSASQRFKKPKAAFLGLPKPQKLVTSRSRRCCKIGNAPLFPRRSGSVGKANPPVVEPSSPKVSCMGRVRSKRDRSRSRRLKNHRQVSSRPQKETEKLSGKKHGGFFSSVRSIFGSRNRARGKLDGSVARSSDIRNRLPSNEADSVRNGSVSPPRTSTAAAAAAAGGLGAMTKFASGRKPELLI